MRSTTSSLPKKWSIEKGFIRNKFTRYNEDTPTTNIKNLLTYLSIFLIMIKFYFI